tara:strand:- start:1246 stop:2088 length:843 start_codon:yes stop_codon:yes gene_type:complete
MATIPSTIGDQMITKIYEGYEEKENDDSTVYLGRLGSSFIGEECIRKIWFDWRGFNREGFQGRILRLFGTGHWQEDRIVEDLRRAGYTIWEKQDDGKQYQLIDETGHFISKLDGVIKGVPEHEDQPHILEIKTHNKSSFNGVLKHGVLKNKPQHYSQVQISMKLSGLTASLYVAVCKDDERFYIERIEADTKHQDQLLKKVKSLYSATMRPAGISDDAGSFGCKFCSMKDVCVRESEPLRNCRTCVMARPDPDGKWLCQLHHHNLDAEAQRAGCEEYIAL